MNDNLLKIYNSLMFLTRKKNLYIENNIKDTFSNRLILFFFHFAFFLKIYKQNNSKDLIQKIYDFVFKQIELSLREIGYGDVSINKKMKDYINIFHIIIDKISNWDSFKENDKSKILNKYIDAEDKLVELSSYFEKYVDYLTNNNLNFFVKSVNKHKF